MFYVYLLKSKVDGRYYIGQTDNIEERLYRHNNGLVPATRHRRPLIFLGSEEYTSRDAARFREHTLKRNAHERRKFYRKFDKLLSP